MTIGPEPMTRMRFRSVRRGMENRPEARGAMPRTPATHQLRTTNYKLRTLVDLVQELPEQVVGVVRSGRRLGMVLHGEHGFAGVPQSFDGAVVQIEVGDPRVGR